MGVDKAALLERFCRDKPAFYFTAGLESSRAQMRRFIAELALHKRGGRILDP